MTNRKNQNSFTSSFFSIWLVLLLVLNNICWLPPAFSEALHPEPVHEDHLRHDRLIVKHGAIMLVLDDQGQIPAKKKSSYGLYMNDTRYLSKWQWRINGQALKKTKQNTKEGFAAKFKYLTNSQTKNSKTNGVRISRLLTIDDKFFDRLVIENKSDAKRMLALTLNVGADFRDIFEVRGTKRKKRGRREKPYLIRKESSLKLSYKGLDGKSMVTQIEPLNSGLAPNRFNSKKYSWKFKLDKGEKQIIELAVSPGTKNFKKTNQSALEAYRSAQKKYSSWKDSVASIKTENKALNKITDVSLRDLYILKQPSGSGYCIAAGLPWFATVFGRDQIITAKETLLIAPDVSKNVLLNLAHYQGKKRDSFTKEEKGKILHELRIGEMARCKEIPFIPFYGSIDSTPLWLSLLGKYTIRAGDLELAKKLMPKAVMAFDYLESQLKDTYLAYDIQKGDALKNEGWKDSYNSIVHKDGSLAKPPIALCEVQGNLYEAYKTISRVASLLGDKPLANKLRKKAKSLKDAFQKDFLIKDKGFVALAIDGNRKKCEAITTNAGQSLATGIVNRVTAGKVVKRLMKPDIYSGWGLRTLSSRNPAFNPNSYHNGSVWPHDNALVVEGMCRFGFKKDAAIIIKSMKDIALASPETRLPELVGGDKREMEDSSPVEYPMACSPQAWSAMSIFHMLGSLLGIEVSAIPEKSAVLITEPYVPAWMGSVTVKNLSVGKSKVSIRFFRKQGKTQWRVLENKDNVPVRAIFPKLL